MATRAYHVTSVYEAPEAEGVDLDGIEVEAGWRSGQDPSRRHMPTFVKPSGRYDESGRPVQPPEDDEIQVIGHNPAAIGKWYKQLSRERPADPASVLPLPGSSLIASSVIKSDQLAEAPQFGPYINKSKGLLRSNTSIGEMLARDPPPLPSEPRVEPPVWTALGPSNRGYALLQQRGWQEGRGLGIAEVRPASRSDDVVNLTVDSDSEVDTASEDFGTDRIAGSDDRRTLLTPLPTVLRSNRTGLGSTKGAKRTIGNTTDAVRFLEDTRRQKRREQRQESNGGAKAARRKAKIESRQRTQLLSELKST